MQRLGARENGISLVAVDLDGTLLTSQRTLAPQGAHLLMHAHRRGVRVVLATTRNPDTVQPFCRALQIEEPIICTNGAQVWGTPEGPVWVHHTVPRNVALSIAHMADERDWELSTTVGSTTYWRQRPGQVLGEIAPQRLVVPTNRDAVVGDPVRILVSQQEAIAGIRSLCEAQLADRCQVETYTRSDGMVHSLGVFSPQATKGTALALVLERLEIGQERVIAIGNDLCDLAMFLHARVRVIMGNASEEVKRRAAAMGATVAPNSDDEGVAWALKAFLS